MIHAPPIKCFKTSCLFKSEQQEEPLDREFIFSECTSGESSMQGLVFCVWARHDISEFCYFSLILCFGLCLWNTQIPSLILCVTEDVSPEKSPRTSQKEGGTSLRTNGILGIHHGKEFQHIQISGIRQKFIQESRHTQKGEQVNLRRETFLG